MLKQPQCVGIKLHPEEHGYPIRDHAAPATNRADVHRTCSVNVEPQPQPTGVPQQPSATTFSRPAPPFSTVVNTSLSRITSAL